MTRKPRQRGASEFIGLHLDQPDPGQICGSPYARAGPKAGSRHENRCPTPDGRPAARSLCTGAQGRTASIKAPDHKADGSAAL